MTAEDIEQGQPEDACWCPVALAVRRATGADRVAVDAFTISVDGDAYPAPPEVATFVERFDTCCPGVPEPEPLEFDLLPFDRQAPGTVLVAIKGSHQVADVVLDTHRQAGESQQETGEHYETKSDRPAATH